MGGIFKTFDFHSFYYIIDIMDIDNQIQRIKEQQQDHTSQFENFNLQDMNFLTKVSLDLGLHDGNKTMFMNTFANLTLYRYRYAVVKCMFYIFKLTFRTKLLHLNISHIL